MKTASQDLMHEHEAISVALEIVEKMAKQSQSGIDISVTDVEKILNFLKVFADKCHHGKEEDIFFPVLGSVGFSTQMGPVAVMLSEHTLGRKLIKEMNDSVEGGKLDKESFAQAAIDYTYLMRSHIDKENNILFPMGDSRLTESQQKELLEKFEIHENTVIGAGKHEEFHALLKEFKIKYL